MNEELQTETVSRADKIKAILGHPLVTLLILVAVIGSLFVGLANSLSNRHLIECLKEYNDSSAMVTRERARIADEDRALQVALENLDRQDMVAFNEMMRVLIDSSNPVPVRQAALNKYLGITDTSNVRRQEIYKQQESNKIERSRQQLPQPPSLACD